LKKLQEGIAKTRIGKEKQNQAPPAARAGIAGRPSRGVRFGYLPGGRGYRLLSVTLERKASEMDI